MMMMMMKKNKMMMMSMMMTVMMMMMMVMMMMMMVMMMMMMMMMILLIMIMMMMMMMMMMLYKSIRTYCDSDFGGCLTTRKSITGLRLIVGQHCLKHSSNLQSTVSLSSGEAEYYALIKASSAGMGKCCQIAVQLVGQFPGGVLERPGTSKRGIFGCRRKW